MSLALMLAVVGLVALVASWLHYVYWVRRFTLELPYELVERVETPDGSAIELRRLPRGHGASDAARGQGEASPPVLLVHGIALNHRNNDLTEDLSLGRALSKAGRDVWLLTLRSGRDDLGFFEERRVSFERMAKHDLPIGVAEVLRRTGASQLDYVGFSMGGMLLYASLGRFVPEAQVRRVAIIGSPASIEPPLAMLSRVARLVPGWLVPTLRLRIVSRFLAFMAEWIRTPIHRWVYDPDNVEPGTAPYAMVNGFVNIPHPLATEFIRWAADHGVVRFEGTPVTETLRAVRTPVFFVAGAGDRIAPPRAVRRAFEAWGADADVEVDKQFTLVGIETGAAADYGHGDLAIGRFAEQDVFDPVRGFLAA